MLYIGTGDAGRPALSADRRSLAGKVLRVDTFGRPDKDNPDPSSPVYSLGHGRLAGLCLSGVDQVYTTEPGRAGQDEVNRVEAGRDYGWPGGTRAGAAAPDREIPAAVGGLSGCAIIERGLFITSTTGRRLYALPLDGSGEPGSPSDYLIGAYGRLRTIVAGPGRRAVVDHLEQGRRRQADPAGRPRHPDHAAGRLHQLPRLGPPWSVRPSAGAAGIRPARRGRRAARAGGAQQRVVWVGSSGSCRCALRVHRWPQRAAAAGGAEGDGAAAG